MKQSIVHIALVVRDYRDQVHTLTKGTTIWDGRSL